VRWVNYSRYQGEDLGIGAEDLLQALADILLDSGLRRRDFRFSELGGHSFEELREAVEEALRRGALAGEEAFERLRERLAGLGEGELRQLAERLVRKLMEEGYLRAEQGAELGGLEREEAPVRVRLELTDKSLDFLGYKALKDLLGALGRSSFGAHDTREAATGIEASGAAKAYEFGDTLNLDIGATLLSALRRQGPRLPLELDYPDLHVVQAEYQSSCATVLMLDASHSMILYGEDRFTPAKKVALALAHLIRAQYPGDSLRCVLFHDRAQELKLSELAGVQVGPYYTNTREGLILAQRLLARERKDMKQIILITDGKPSAITLEDGRIYRNAFGLDPLVVARTLEEVSRCKRQGILINTFMLAEDGELVAFVRQVAELCRGKAYFTTPYTLGRYLLLDYLNRKTRTVH
jgi:Ca-activated chloride channel family protein